MLAAADRALHRFGASHHRYQLDPVAPSTARLDLLPEDLRTFATTVGAGGAGPGYGLIALERAIEFVHAAPPGVTRWTRALPVAHLGCGYTASVPLDGPARG